MLLAAMPARPASAARGLRRPELMAPAGDWAQLKAAVTHGADAVYFGADKLNLRVKSGNFTLEELAEVTAYCHEHHVSAAFVLNALVRQKDIQEVERVLAAAAEANVDMVICWDHAVITRCRELGIPFCLSTQASIANAEAARFYASLGARRVVAARECSLQEIAEIKAGCGIELEAFIHGAMCIAVSGRCFLSHEIYNKSANDGECMQTCRREFEVHDKRLGEDLIIGSDYILSAKDLCTIDFLDKLIDAGIDSFKIEGRKRSADYVARAVQVYRRAIDAHATGMLTPEFKAQCKEQLAEVYNRGFSSGFYMADPGAADFSEVDGNAATTRRVYLGKVLDYYKIPKVAYVELQSGSLSTGQQVMIIGKTSGVVDFAVGDIYCDERPGQAAAAKGEKITFLCPEPVRAGDKVYTVVKEQPAVAAQ